MTRMIRKIPFFMRAPDQFSADQFNGPVQCGSVQCGPVQHGPVQSRSVQCDIRGNVVGIAVVFAVPCDCLAHSCTSCIFKQGDGIACSFDSLEVSFIVLAVGSELDGKFVSAVIGDSCQDFFLHDSIKAALFAVLDAVGYKYVAAIDDNGKTFVFASSENVDEAVKDTGAGVYIEYIRIVDPESVDALFLEVCSQFVYDEILPYLFGSVDPTLTLPVCVTADRVFLETVVIGTVGGDGTDAQIGINLSPAGFKLFDLGSGIILCIDDDGLVVFDAGSISVQIYTDENAPGRGRGCVSRYRGDGHYHSKADCRGEKKRQKALLQRSGPSCFVGFTQNNPPLFWN